LPLHQSQRFYFFRLSHRVILASMCLKASSSISTSFSFWSTRYHSYQVFHVTHFLYLLNLERKSSKPNSF
jgi:hypothetical protein